jgi:hypothetical protein
MCSFLKSCGRRLSGGFFWIAVLLILPNCALPVSGLPGGGGGPEPGPENPGPNFNPGPVPRNSVIFCYIEKPVPRKCMTPDDIENGIGIRLKEAAIALNEGNTGNIGIDESSAARARCDGLGFGEVPELVEFQGAFPEGFPVCVNCDGAIGGDITDVNVACQVRCLDFFTTATEGTEIPENPPDADSVVFCTHARAATNQPLDTCFPGLCTAAGTLLPDYLDPRRASEPVKWQAPLVDVDVVGATGTDLTRIGGVGDDFDAGAASEQHIKRGDAFVEFSALHNNQGHVIGFAQIPDPCAAPCPDPGPGLSDITFGLVLSAGGKVDVRDNGVDVIGTDPDGTFGGYVAGERFRVRLRDNSDGTAVVSFTRLACTPACTEDEIYSTVAQVPYAFRVEASLRQVGATLTDVRVVRIQ